MSSDEESTASEYERAPSRGEFAPLKSEVMLQLGRMMRHPVFRQKVQHAETLKCIVESTLNGRVITQRLVRDQVFPELPDDKLHKVRDRIAELKDLLVEYYATDGKYDEVVIQLPEKPRDKETKRKPGEAYTPWFEYNENLEEMRLIRRAKVLAGGTITQAVEASIMLQPLMDTPRFFPFAIVLTAESWMAVIKGGGVPDGDRVALIANVRRMLEHAESMYPDAWRIERAHAILCMFENDLAGATTHFDAARELDAQRTMFDVEYIWFCARTGRLQDTQAWVAYCEKNGHVSSLRANYGLYLAMIGEGAKAVAVLADVVFQLDPNNYGAHWGLVMGYLSVRKVELAREQAAKLKGLLEPNDYDAAIRLADPHHLLG